MLHTHAEAIEVLLRAGIPASRRDWALGDTVVVPLGHPSTTNGITVHPSVAWLVPAAPGWRVEQAVANIPRILLCPDLGAACAVAIDIAQAFGLRRPCQHCNLDAEFDFGERDTPRGLQFWTAARCSHCGSQVEADGLGALPDGLGL